MLTFARHTLEATVTDDCAELDKPDRGTDEVSYVRGEITHQLIRGHVRYGQSRVVVTDAGPGERESAEGDDHQTADFVKMDRIRARSVELSR